MSKQLPPTVRFCAYAVDARGHSLPDLVWGWEMPVMAHVPTIEEGRSFANRVLNEDDRAAAVHIRESVQNAPGEVWKAGRHVETVSSAEADAVRILRDAGI